MRRFYCICVMITLYAMLLTGCQAQRTQDEHNDPDKPFTVYVEDGQYYLKCNIPDISQHTDGASMKMQPYVYFSSAKEMKEDILAGNYTSEEIAVLTELFYGSGPAIQIPNLDNLYEPIFPRNFSGFKIAWRISSYQFNLLRENSNEPASFRIVSKEDFDKSYASSILPSRPHNASNYSCEIDENGRRVEQWNKITNEGIYYGTGQRIKYTINRENKVIHVFEYFEKDTNKAATGHATILIKDGEQYYRIYIPEYTTPLTEEEILQFGIRDYVETETQ